VSGPHAWGSATFNLGLRLLDAPARPAAAWFLPGDDAAAWLDGLVELARALGLSATAFGLWIIDGAGVVAVPAGPNVALMGLPTGALRAQPYGRVGERLLAPVDAALAPDVTTTELDALLASEQHLLHPVVGLVQLDPSARRTVLDLLAAPPRVAGRWRPLEPPTAPLRLTSIEVEDPPPLEEWMRAGGGGVGESPLSEAPPAPSEASQQQQQQGWMTTQAAKLVQWATGGADGEPPPPPPPPPEPKDPASPAPEPAGPPPPGLLDRLRSWAQQTLARDVPDVQSERERELRRLMHLLENDPDEGLRFALPLKGGSSPPSNAPPGAKLPPRRVDYSPDGPRRGAQGDAWTIDPEVHRRLVERYREVANRELRLGRYRRAAYVFAELLGDLSAAASALEQGRHYREAAALHRDALGRPLDAARCLERGGLLDEAAAIYEAEGKFVEAGDLWGRLERAREAERAYRRAVAARVSAGDPLSAARLLETKLDRPDEALDVLAAAWPGHAQAGLCLEDRLGLLGRLARHEAAARLLGDLRQDARRVGRELVLAKAIGAAASRYPEAGVQARAADLVRVVAGERLQATTVGTAEVEALLQVLGRLDPADRLLLRDVGRLSAQRRREAAQARAKAAPLPSTPRRTGWGPIVRAEQRLPTTAGFSWRAAAVVGDVLWAVGVSPPAPGGSFLPDTDLRRVVVHRTRLSGTARQGGAWTWNGKDPVLLAVSLAVPPVVSAGGQRPPRPRPPPPPPPGPPPPPPPRPRPPAADMPQALLGTPGWLPDGARALATNDEGLVWVVHDGAAADVGLVLASYDAGSGGALLGTCAVASPNETTILPLELELDLDGEVREDPPLLAADDGARAALAVGGNLMSFLGTTPVARWRLERPARDLALRGPAIAVSHDDGGRLYAGDADAEPCRFGEGLHAPRLAFTPDGLLVALATDEGRIYELVDGGLEHRGTFQGPGGEVLCVRQGTRAREVVVVMKSGTVRVMAITRSD
jgi:tetratricopeptide (TPR) repeat protein